VSTLPGGVLSRRNVSTQGLATPQERVPGTVQVENTIPETIIPTFIFIECNSLARMSLGTRHVASSSGQILCGTTSSPTGRRLVRSQSHARVLSVTFRTLEDSDWFSTHCPSRPQCRLSWKILFLLLCQTRSVVTRRVIISR